MDAFKFGKLVVVAHAALLAGCMGKNVVLKEDAAKLSADMATVVAQSREFYKSQSAAKADFLIRILAQGENCRYEFPVVLVTEIGKPTRCLSDAERAGIGSSGAPLPDGAKTHVFNLMVPADQAALQMIAVIAEFQTVVAKIVEDPKFDAGAQLEGVIDRACGLSERLEGLGGQGIAECKPTAADAAASATPESTTTALFKEERDALSAVINLARKANEDRKDIGQLTKAYTESGERVSKALTSLLAQYQGKDIVLSRALELSEVVAKRRALNVKLAALPQVAGKLDSETRYSLMVNLHSTLTNQSAVKSPDPLSVSLEGLIKTHKAFQAALLDGQLTPEQRARIAKSTFEQLKSWFNVLRTLTTVF